MITQQASPFSGARAFFAHTGTSSDTCTVHGARHPVSTVLFAVEDFDEESDDIQTRGVPAYTLY